MEFLPQREGEYPSDTVPVKDVLHSLALLLFAHWCCFMLVTAVVQESVLTRV